MFYDWQPSRRTEHPRDFLKDFSGTVAEEAYNQITEIMHFDNGLDDLPVEGRTKQHQFVIKPKFNAYFEWVKTKRSQVIHNSVLGKTLTYRI